MEKTGRKWCLIYTETTKTPEKEIVRRPNGSLCVEERVVPLIQQQGSLLEMFFQNRFPSGIKNVNQAKQAALLAFDIIRDDVRTNDTDGLVILGDPYLGTYETRGIIEVPQKLHRLSGMHAFTKNPARHR